MKNGDDQVINFDEPEKISNAKPEASKAVNPIH